MSYKNPSFIHLPANDLVQDTFESNAIGTEAGFEHLSDIDLLSTLLPSTAKITSRDRAQSIICHYGSLQEVCKAPSKDISKKFRLGASAIDQLKISLEIGKRYLAPKPRKGDTLNSSSALRTFLESYMKDKAREEFLIFYLDNRFRLIQSEVLFKGTIDSTSIHSREVLRRCFELMVSSVIFVHNHPSGCSKPSEADLHITKKLRKLLGMVNINILDHFVIGEGEITSFAEEGII